MLTTKINRTARTLEFYRDGCFVRDADLGDAAEIARVRAELVAATTKALILHG